MKNLILYIAFYFVMHFAYTQTLFYSDLLQGGVTGSGFALSFGSNGSGFFNINIPVSSTIRKAFLISGRNGNAPNLVVDFNGNSLVFDSTNIVSNSFQSFYGGTSNVHAIEVTSFVSPSINQYLINITTTQQTSANRYNEFYLYVLYENNTYPILCTYLFLNDQDFGFANYNLINLNPINNINDVGLSLFTGYMCDTIVDGENIYINGNIIGLIGGNDINSGACGGPYGDFYYENNQLFGLSDDMANSQMKGTDVLVNMNTLLITQNTTSFLLSCIPQQTVPLNKDNNIWAFFLTYTTPCDTFTTTATTTQDTICLGDSVQLNATGGSTYSWFGAFGGLSDTSNANPVASPPQTTTYIVTIKNDSGCVKTEHIKIWVRPTPEPDTIVITPQTCGNPNGSITVGTIPNGAAPFTIVLTNLQTSNIEPQTSNLLTGNYQLTITDNNGCVWQSDTLFVPTVNNVVANFNNQPQAPFSNPTLSLGKAPMEVSFFNTSQNANMYEWSITQQPNNDTIIEIPTCTGIAGSCGLQHFFTQGGAYEVCLIAYNNQPQCADTVCKTIFIDANEEISLFIPNVFTPNGHNENDNFILQITGAELLERLEVEVFNRWGMLVQGLKFDVQGLESEAVIWNGTTTAGNEASEGTYFYVITYTTKLGETVVEKGTVSLLR